MDREFDRPEYEFRVSEYTSFYNLVRQLGQDLRSWLPLHTDRWSRASNQDLTLNLLGRSYWLLRNARLNRDQRRWALQPVGGDLINRLNEILESLKTTPEEMAHADSHFEEEDFDSWWEEMRPAYHQEKERLAAEEATLPPGSVTQQGFPMSPWPQQWDGDNSSWSYMDS